MQWLGCSSQRVYRRLTIDFCTRPNGPALVNGLLMVNGRSTRHCWFTEGRLFGVSSGGETLTSGKVYRRPTIYAYSGADWPRGAHGKNLSIRLSGSLGGKLEIDGILKVNGRLIVCNIVMKLRHGIWPTKGLRKANQSRNLRRIEGCAAGRRRRALVHGR